MAATLVGIVAAINTLTPLATQLINQLRQSGETDEQVVARARTLVEETRQITSEDMSDVP